MSLTLLIFVLIIGLVLLTLEIVALPGGIAGIAGTVMIVFGVWKMYACFGTTAGTIALLASVAVCIVLLAIFLKTKTWKRFSLTEESDSKVNQIDAKVVAIGSKGKTVARLAPTGKAFIDGQLVEVHAVNKFIDPDRPIEVIAIEGYRIDVCEISDDRFTESNNQ